MVPIAEPSMEKVRNRPILASRVPIVHQRASQRGTRQKDSRPTQGVEILPYVLILPYTSLVAEHMRPQEFGQFLSNKASFMGTVSNGNRLQREPSPTGTVSNGNLLIQKRIPE